MNGVRKFAFDTEFAPDGAIVSAAPKRLGPEEVEAECAAAYERGKQDAVAQAERQAAAALDHLANTAAAVLAKLEGESRAMRSEAARVALAAARKIADASLEAFGAERAQAAVEAAMDALRGQPRLVLRLAPQSAEQIAPRIAAMCATHGYEGAVLTRVEKELRAGDVIIDWSDGVISTRAADIADRVETLIEAALAAAEPT